MILPGDGIHSDSPKHHYHINNFSSGVGLKEIVYNIIRICIWLKKVSTSSETTGSQRLIKYNPKTIATGKTNIIGQINRIHITYRLNIYI